MARASINVFAVAGDNQVSASMMWPVVNSSEVRIPGAIPSAVIWVHMVIVWVVETGIAVVAIVPRVIITAVPSAVIPRVVSVIPWIIETAIVSAVVAAVESVVVTSIVPWTVSIAP